MTGLLIAFEGGDASGKTTQARRISELIGAVFTREPGGTEVGESLRELLLSPEIPLAFRTEALLMAASRAQLVEEVIRPNLETGKHVVSDRFLASSIVYQGYATGLPVDEVRGLSIFATNGLLPDLTILIDLPVELSIRRRTDMPDRFESEAIAGTRPRGLTLEDDQRLASELCDSEKEKREHLMVLELSLIHISEPTRPY